MWLVRRKIGWEYKIKQDQSGEGGEIQQQKNSLFFTHLLNTYTHTTWKEKSATFNCDINKEWPWVDSSQKRKHKRPEMCEKKLNYTCNMRKCMMLNLHRRTSPVVQWLRLHAPSAGGPGSIPGQGTRSRVPQLNIPHAKTKTRHSQINKQIKFEKK